VKLPRDVSGQDLVHLLSRLEYETTRQAGSHMRLTRQGEVPHHITVPLHESLKAGTLSGILKEVAEHLNIGKDELMAILWGGED